MNGGALMALGLAMACCTASFATRSSNEDVSDWLAGAAVLLVGLMFLIGVTS